MALLKKMQEKEESHRKKIRKKEIELCQMRDEMFFFWEKRQETQTLLEKYRHTLCRVIFLSIKSEGKMKADKVPK